MAFGNVLGQSGTALPYINGNYDAGNHNIKNVADPIDETDAVNLRSLNSQIDVGSLFKKNLIHTSVFNSSTPTTDYWGAPSLTISNFPIGYCFEITTNNLVTTSSNFDIIFGYTNYNKENTEIIRLCTLDARSNVSNPASNCKIYNIAFIKHIGYAQLNSSPICNVTYYDANLPYKNDQQQPENWYIYLWNPNITQGSLTVSMYWF